MDKDAEAEYSLLDEGSGRQPARKVCRFSRLHLWSWAAQLLLLAASATMLRLAQDDGRCVNKLSSWSPALEAVADEYRWYRFNGTVNGASPYKGRPVGMVFDAWEELTSERMLSIDHATLVRIGAPESAVKVPEKAGGGYMAAVEMMHQLHCVKELFYNTWPDFYHPDAGNETTPFRMHLDHCADLLRQKLLCDADAGLVTLNWIQHLSHPTPNFNTLHKCRRWENLQAWAKEHEIGELLELPRPNDAIVLDDFP